MGVRKQHNRYRTEPFGTDYKEVLKKGKAFHRMSEEFVMMTTGKLFDGSESWMATSWIFGTMPEGSKLIKWNRETKHWEERPILNGEKR